jgi:outer membrane protein assembly factor BamB
VKITITRTCVLALVCSAVALPQGRPIDWPSFGGDARRSGFARNDLRITKENGGKLQLLFRRKVDNSKGPQALTPPVVIGLLISWKGFKELGFVSSNSGTMLALDVDLNKPFWQKSFDTLGGACAGNLTAMPSLTPPMIFGGRRPGAGAAGARPAAPAAPLPARLGGGGFGGSRPVWMLAANGQLRQINSADGSDQYPALNFVPAGSKATVLTMNNNVVYTTTVSGCGSSKDAVWAMDLRNEEPKAVSFDLPGKAAGTGGFALGMDGTVYVQTVNGSLLALGAHDLKKVGEVPTGAGAAATPVVFENKGNYLVVTAGGDGKLHVIDTKTVTELSSTPLAGVTGGLSTWEDADGGRWVGAPTATSLVAFKVEDEGGKPVLKQAWKSRELNSPLPPVVTSGIVYVLSTGAKGNAKATLYGFDAATGKEVYSSGSQIAGTGTQTGLTLANGRIYFTTTDATLWCFGIGIEI